MKDEYFTRLSLTMENPVIEVEFQKHEAWQKNQLRSTPTILVVCSQFVNVKLYWQCSNGNFGWGQECPFDDFNLCPADASLRCEGCL